MHDIERNAGRLGEAGATKGSGDDLIVTATRAKKIAEFAVFSTEALGGIMAFEASHTSDPALDAAMVLFKTIVQVGTGPVPHGLAQHGADCSGVGAMTVCRDPVRSKAHGRPRRAEEGLGRLHITMLAQLRVDQVSVPVDRPVEVAPPAANFQVGLVDIPADPGSAPGSVTPFAQRVAHDRQQLCLPVADSLMADFDPAYRHDLTQIPQGQPIAQPAEHDEGDDVAWQAGPVQDAIAALVELSPAVPAAEPPVASRCDLPPLRHRLRATVHAVHPASPGFPVPRLRCYGVSHSPQNIHLARLLTKPNWRHDLQQSQA